ncbi:NAD-dependent epimerase/dehydratase family protein [Kribbella capetownensis]|uniref:NAD-dependent epimerase/dehydratase family protein n=1 Tax=Kribbella capetownensis TaxID=1572659 RepID=A0A4V2M8C5_9ACTN|nr:NAD-dependent epimerase/dehydratase family protein [Kribbella capetownensis]TCC50892.1 NAD-dependent epimerase/dehydratase family protein [Kribbella capetownensis]
MTETVLVTGGTGYVGGWAIVALLGRGYDVRTTVRAASKEQSVREAMGERVGFAIADLMKDDGWDAAMAGVDYVLHVASPLGDQSAKDPDALIVPARDGALRVLRAATRAGVKRVVMTSAANAASPESYTAEGVTDETLWTVDSSSLPAYRRSKTLAEKAVWDFMAGYDGPTELTTVLPGAVFGPILTAHNVGTTQIIQRMLMGKMPGTPKIGLEVVDVRDLVELHLRAMVAPEAAGQRFLGTGEFVWMREIAAALKDALGPQAAKVPTRQLPNFMVRLAAITDPSLRAITISLGRRNRHTTAKAERVLGWKARPAAQTVVECAESLIAHGVVPEVAS